MTTRRIQSLRKALFVTVALSVTAVPAVAQQYQYKLFQYGTSVMERSIETFADTNPGWEIIAMSPMGLRDTQGAGSIPLSILFLARKPASLAITPAQTTVVVPEAPPSPSRVTTVPSRVSSVAAPNWASGTSYADDLATAINARLAPSAAGNGPRRILPAVLDVVIGRDGSVLLVTPRGNRAPASLVNAAVDAIRAVSPFQPIPAGTAIGSISDQTFTFSIAP